MPQDDGFRHEYATINGLRYHYVREGQGQPLLLVHGWPGFSYEWHLNIGPLSQHFDVVVPDMRGYAYTDKPDLAPEDGYTPGRLRRRYPRPHRPPRLGASRTSSPTTSVRPGCSSSPAHTATAYDSLVLFDPPYPGIGGRWIEPGHVPQIWYQMFHQLPWAEDLVGSSRKATELYLRHFLSHWSHDKDLWTDEEIAEYVEAFSQPGADPRRLQLLPRRLPHDGPEPRRRPEDLRPNARPLGRQRRRPPLRLERQARRLLPGP